MRRGSRLIAELLASLAGAALIVASIRADTAWFDRHFLPDMFSSRTKQLALLWTGRGIAAAIGVALLAMVRPWLGRLASRTPIHRLVLAAWPIVTAVVLAVGASELILRSTPWRAAQEAPATREPIRRRDPRLGWTFLTDRSGYGRLLGGRRAFYAIDAHGYRVARPGDQVDLARPSVLFTGESFVFGHGLDWNETLPAQVQAITGLQAADMAVEAYAPDQAYLRLRGELPRFSRPVAVVTVFLPSLFGRILDDDRPHLGPGLKLHPPTEGWRLATLAKRLIPYRSESDLRDGLDVTRAVYRSTLDLARARGAVPIVLVPVYQPEPPGEAAIRKRVLDDARIPYLAVPLDPAWRIAHNKHPDARGDRAMAEAIAAELGRAGVVGRAPAP